MSSKDKVKAGEATARLIGYVDWLSAKSKRFLYYQFTLFIISISMLGYIGADLQFILIFIVPALIAIGGTKYYSKLTENMAKIKESEAQLEEMFNNILEESELDLTTEGDYSLKEAYEYKTIIELANTKTNIPEQPLLTLAGLKTLTNPIPILLGFCFIWALAIELITISVGVIDISFALFK